MGKACAEVSISIHALREEGDMKILWRGWRKQFLSTPSARRATYTSSALSQSRLNFYPRPPRGGRLCVCCDTFTHGKISIHALREEGDSAFISAMTF